MNFRPTTHPEPNSLSTLSRAGRSRVLGAASFAFGRERILNCTVRLQLPSASLLPFRRGLHNLA